MDQKVVTAPATPWESYIALGQACEDDEWLD